MSGLSRIAIPLVAVALSSGCATTSAPKDRPSAYAVPGTDPALGDNVEYKLVATNIEQVQAAVAAPSAKTTQIAILAPELTPAQAEEVRSAFPQVSWRPSEGGKPTATVTIGK